MPQHELTYDSDLISQKLLSKKITPQDLCAFYYRLPHMLSSRPDLETQTFNLLEKTVRCRKNNRYSVENLYSALTEIINKNPETALSAIDVFKINLMSKHNDHYTFLVAEQTFSAICNATPQYAPAMAVIFVQALEAYENKTTPKKPLKKFLHKITENADEIRFKEKILNEIKSNIFKQMDSSGLLNAYMYQSVIQRKGNSR